MDTEKIQRFLDELFGAKDRDEMNNEDIIHTLEEFTKWGHDDKRKVMSSLSGAAIRNLVDSLPLNGYYRLLREIEDHHTAYRTVYDQFESSWEQR